jgi:hypothetical protein
MGQVGICTEGLIWLALHWSQDYVYIVSLYILCCFILLNLVICWLKAIVYQLYPSIIAWIPYDDLWELANTAIEPMTVNRLPVSLR